MHGRSVDRHQGGFAGDGGLARIRRVRSLGALFSAGATRACRPRRCPCMPVGIARTGARTILAVEMEAAVIVNVHRVPVDGHPVGVTRRMEALGWRRLHAVRGIGRPKSPSVGFPFACDLTANLDAQWHWRFKGIDRGGLAHVCRCRDGTADGDADRLRRQHSQDIRGHAQGGSAGHREPFLNS